MARMPYRSQEVMYGFGLRLPKTLVEQVDVARGEAMLIVLATYKD
jgi:hypothetical protein